MSPTFDPYYKWLAIPPAEQPPNHYRLLALNLFETDADVIATAADQRMAHVRSFQGGQYVDASQRLLNELASARLCLLRSDKKAAYDAALRATIAEQAARLTPPAPPPVPVASAPIQAAPPLALRSNAADAADPVARPIANAPEQSQPAYEAAAAPVAFVVGADQPDSGEAIAAVAAAQPAADWHDENDPLGLADPIDRYPKRSAAVRPRKPSFPRIFLIAPLAGIAAVIAAVTYSNLRDADYPDSDDAGAGTAKSIKRPVEPSPHSANSSSKFGQGSTHSGPSSGLLPQFSPSDDSASTSPAGGSEPVATGYRPPENSSPGARSEEKKPTAARLPKPDAESLRKALVEIRKVYKDDFAKAISLEGRQALAKKLGEMADKTKDDPTTRYVLATQSLEIAVKLCDVKLAHDMVSGLSSFYDVDTWELKARTLAELAATAKTPEARQRIATAAFDQAGEALVEERYEAAVQLSSSAADLAATLRDPAFREKAFQAHLRARRMQQEAAEVQAAQERLGLRDDAAAHLLIGRFFCMERDDWDSGLPHLVRGSDADLSVLARRELAGAVQPADQVALADAWWDLADRRRDSTDAPLVKGIRNRAVYWYRRAMPQLNGFAQAKAQKRIAEATAVSPVKP